MKFLQIIFAVERPVRFQEIIARAGSIESCAIDRQKIHPLSNRLDPFPERERGIQIAKQKRSPILERDSRQIIFFARKIFNAVKLRHRNKRAVEPEFSTVITTAHSFDVSLAFHDERAAVRANIRETMGLHFLVDREQKRFVETTFEKRER